MDRIDSIQDIQELAVSGFRDWKRYGNVTVRAEGALLIFNYTVQAQYIGTWNFFEQVSRGLILNAHSGEIVARAFDKFYNWLEGGRRASGHIVTVTEKVDGSLAVLFRTTNGYRLATRGAFTSAQAVWATKFLCSHYDLTGLPNELTLLFEIVYPANRIILNYAGREDLVLLAARNRFTGVYLPFFPDVVELAHRYGFSLPKTYAFNNLTEIMETTGALDFDQEGFVVEFSDGRFKFKGDRYLELQKLVTGLTYKNVLKAMSTHSLEEVLNPIPDEFLDEAKGWIGEIQTTFNAIMQAVEGAFAQAPKSTRKDFALWVRATAQDLAPYLFARLDGHPVEPLIYKVLLAQAGSRADTIKVEDGET